MWRQVEQMTEEGIAEPVARAAVAERVATVHRRRHLVNHNRVLDTARLIGLPLLNIHLPPDIVTRRFIQDLIARNVPARASIGSLLEVLSEVPEMRESLVKPEVWIGDQENIVDRAVVAIAGGTNGGYPVFRTYYAAGVKTILAMHIDEADFLRLRAEVPGGLQLRRHRPHALRLDRDQPPDLGPRGPRAGLHEDQRHHRRAAISIGLTAPTR